MPGVTFVDADDPAALDALVDDRTAAIIVEPIQGEGGVRPISPALARRHRGRVRADGRAAHRRRSAVRLGRTGTFLY